MRLLAVVALLCAVAAQAAALDFPQRDGRVIDEARLLDPAAKAALENRLANLETQTSRQLMVVTLASARGMTVDDYGLALRRHWGLEPNGRRVALIVAPHDGRSVIQFDRSLHTILTDPLTDRILAQAKSRFNAGDFTGGVIRGAHEIIEALSTQAPLRVAQSGPAPVPATAEFPALTGRVVDAAGMLDAATRESLRRTLQALEEKTGAQLVVATVRSLNGNSVEEYANRLFRRWQLGQRGKNNGVLLLHAPKERKIRIEVGYGLEGVLTDAVTKYIIQNSITPRFRANDFAGGMTRGVDDIVKVLSGEAEEYQRRAAPSPFAWLNKALEVVFSPFGLFFLPVALILVLHAMSGIMDAILDRLAARGLIRKRERRRRSRGSDDGWWVSSGSDSYSSSSSSWGSSSGGSSDSFSGGGGDSGGGGASGDY